MEILKLIVLGIIISFTVVMVKQIKPEFALMVAIAGSIILLVSVFGHFSRVIGIFNEIVSKTGISQELFSSLIKIIGIGYLIEFSASLCVDSGNSSIGDKIVLGGKILIFVMAIPIISSLFETIVGLLQ